MAAARSYFLILQKLCPFIVLSRLPLSESESEPLPGTTPFNETEWGNMEGGLLAETFRPALEAPVAQAH